MQKQKTPKPFRLSERTLNQLSTLVADGYNTNETAAVTEAVNMLYYHKVEQANEITIASRKVAEQPAHPELTTLDGKLWLNLGSGLLADGAAAMLKQQFPNDVETRQNAVEEWLIYHRQASQDAYATMRAIIMFRF